MEAEKILAKLWAVENEPISIPAGLTIEEIEWILMEVKKIFLEQPILLEIRPPLTICGDTHGQFHDTLRLFKTGKLPQVVLEEFIEFVQTDVIIGHNVNFDLGFLQNKCKKYLGYSLSNDYIDTLFLARKLVPNSINHKLGTLAKLFNINYDGAHRGLKDVEITYELYNKLREIK